MYVILVDGAPVGTCTDEPTRERLRALRLRLSAHLQRRGLKVRAALRAEGSQLVSWPGGAAPTWLDTGPVRVGIGGPARARKQRVRAPDEAKLGARVNVRFLPAELARLEAQAGEEGVGPYIRRVALASLS